MLRDRTVDNEARKSQCAWWLLVALSIAVAAAAIAAAVNLNVLTSERRNEGTDQWVDHTHQVIATIGSLMISADNAEMQQRDFILTGDSHFLTQYESGLTDIWQRFSTVKALTVDNSSQRSRLQILHALLDGKIALLSHSIELARSGNRQAAVDLLRAGEGGAIIEAVRGTIANMVAEEQRLLLIRHQDQARSRQWTNRLLIVLSILAGCSILVCGGLIVAATLTTSNRRKAAATAAERLRQLSMLELAPIMMRDFGGRVRFWSEGCCRLYGWTAEQAIGRLSHELLQTDGPVPFETIEAMLLRNGEWNGELRQRTQHGAEIIVSAYKALHRDPDGRNLAILETLVDVTYLRQTEAALQASETQFRSVVAAAADAIIIAHSDGKIQSLNPATLRIFGYDHAEELIGRNLSALLPVTEAVSHATYIENNRPNTPPQVINLPGRELRATRRDGSEFPIDLSVSSFDINGQRYLTGIIRDVSCRQQAAIALRDSEARERLVQQVGGIAYTDRTSPDPAALVSREFNRIYGLPLEHTRVPLAEIVACWHPEDRDRIAAIMAVSLESGEKVATEFRICRPDGEIRWVSMRTESFLGQDGRPSRIITAQQDITELVAARETLAARQTRLEHLSRHLIRARDRAEQANRAKSRFLAGMSHELRTPLSGILGYAQLLHIEGDLNAAQSARVDAMLVAGKHLLEMITCVLDLSEIEAEHVVLRAVEVDAQAIMAASFDLVRPAAEAKGLDLSLVVTPGTPLNLVADPTRLRQVLLNLLGNAVKFTTEGSICLQLRPLTDGVRIEVADTGPGIPFEQRQRLFQDFERLDTEATSKAEGAGLGLALSARLAALMGGRLGHENRPGGGSVFWLELPLNTPVILSPAAVEVDDKHDADPAPLGALRILVVDDVLMNRDIASSFLRIAGHAVTCIDNGVEAIAAVASTDFDVVLMDVRMPEMDGLEATRRIRALMGARGRVPIVALTAQAFTDQVAECHKAGMTCHLAKPFDSDTLLAAVVHAVKIGPLPTLSTPSPIPVNLITPIVAVELPIFNQVAFERTVGFLTPEMVHSYLMTIAKLGEILLRELRAPDALTLSNELAEAAHRLVGSAGMFGFDRLADTGRRFERAVQAVTAETSALVDAFCNAIHGSLDEVTRISATKFSTSTLGDPSRTDDASAGVNSANAPRDFAGATSPC